MSKIEKILIAVDGSPHSFNAATYVAQTCPPPNVKVNLIHILSMAPETFWDLEKEEYFKAKIKPKYSDWKRSRKQTAQRFLDDAKRLMVKAGMAEDDVGVILKEREVGVARDIVTESQSGYDAVAVGRRGLSKLEDLFLGSVSNKIVEGIKEVPICVVGGQIRSKRVLLAVDASDNSRRAADYAGALAATAEADLTVFHVVRRVGLSLGDEFSLSNEEIEGFAEQVMMDSKRMLKSYGERLKEAGVTSARISRKYALHSYSRSADILKEAKEGNYGTIVVGRRGLSKVGEFLLGRVTNKVLIRAAGHAVWIVP